MEPVITLFSIIMLLGAAHGVFLSLALVNTRSGNATGHIYLAMLTLAFSIDLAHEFLYQSRYLLSVLELANIDPVINLIYGPLFYLYVRALTDGKDLKQDSKRWLHFLPVVIGIVACFFLPVLDVGQYAKLYYESVTPTSRVAEIVQSVTGVIAMTSVISIGVYLVISIKRLQRHANTVRQQFSSIEKITLNWLRNLLAAIAVLYLILILDGILSSRFDLGDDVNHLLYIMIVAVIYTMGYLGLRQPEIFSESYADQVDTENEHGNVVDNNKYKGSALDDEMSTALRDELLYHMETERPYLDSQLTLAQLAGQLGISSNYLSQVINEQFEKNFFDFVNDYRVEQAKKFLAEPDRADANIITIAYDAGFNSKSAFYTAFNRLVGMSPSKFRKSKKTGSEST
jgi:AraC-like DNA-binding protein